MIVLQRTEHNDLSKPTYGRGNKSFDFGLAQTIQEFYLNEEISRQSSSTKDTGTPKDVSTVVIRYMTMSIDETFELFSTRYPDIKVRAFKSSIRYGPSWVRENCPHDVSMCIQH